MTCSSPTSACLQSLCLSHFLLLYLGQNFSSHSNGHTLGPYFLSGKIEQPVPLYRGVAFIA